MRLLLVLLAALMAIPALAAFVDTPHPFILWTPAEAAAIRATVEREPWAQSRYRQMLADTNPAAVPVNNLFRYVVMGDRAAGEVEKRALLTVGGLKQDENLVTMLRYDCLYDLLSDAERERVERVIRDYVRQVIRLGPGYKRTRANWLPNMEWCGPAMFSAHLGAVAIKDEALLRELWATPGVGFKWYLDAYLCDSGFYNEEFNKMAGTPGTMLVYCRGAARIGLDELGFGYRGAGGATMRGHIESLLRLGYPRVDLGTDRAHYPMVTIGDAKGGAKGTLGAFPGYGWQSALVQGYTTDGNGGDETLWYNGGRMGPNKMSKRMWFEIAAATWPDAGFPYILAQMRGPDEDRYYPTLYWGLAPIDPMAVAPPPAPSGVYRQRGIAMLRADESPAYWESEAPAVSMRHSTEYCHHVMDGFSLTGFYAFNRPIYVNRQHSSNYAGVDPTWSNHMHSHCGVSVDNQSPKEVGEAETRQDFSPLVKFHAARIQGAYPDVDMTRGLFLTREYLFDVFALASPRPRAYQWAVHALGRMCPDNPNDWGPTQHLVGTQSDMADERSYSTSKTWGVAAVQYTTGADPTLSALGARWFEAPRVGVRVRMLGEDGTTAYTATSPVYPEGQDRFMFGADEPGGASILAARSGRETAFVALHEPFKGGSRVAEFRRIWQTDNAVCAAVVGMPGSGIDDRVMFAWGRDAEALRAVAADEECFVFRGHALVRIAKDTVQVTGNLVGMRLRVDGRPRLIVNGRDLGPGLIDGVAQFGEFPRGEYQPFPPRTLATSSGPIAAWWKPEVLCLPSDGRGTATVRLRNNGHTAITQGITFRASTGVKIEPATVALTALAPGAELDVPVTITPDRSTYNQVLTVELTSTGPAQVQLAALKVVHGLSAEKSLVRPNDFAITVFAPRYITKYYYMQSALPRVLLDPDGLRRFENGSVPEVKALTKGPDGKEKWEPVKYGNLSHMWLHQVRPFPKQPIQLDEAGQHPHGFRSPFEHRFTEDWVWLRCKDVGAAPVVYDWFTNVRDPRVSPAIAARVWPAKVLVVDGDTIREVPVDDRGRWSLPKDVKAVTALFWRQAGFRYGQVMLYPPTAMPRGNEVAVPGTDGVAFAFCLEDDLPALVTRWREQPPFVPVRAQKSGEIWPEWP